MCAQSRSDRATWAVRGRRPIGGTAVGEKNFTVITRVGTETAVLRASGHIDHQTLPLLGSELWKVIEQTTVALVVLDVNDVDFVSFAGLAMLVTAAQSAERCHKRFAVVTGDRSVFPRALHIAGLDRSVPTCRAWPQPADLVRRPEPS